MKKILVIGGGAMGSAFTIPCLENKNKVSITEPYSKNFIKELLEQAIKKKEIKAIDVKAFAILLGGIGREFFKEENKRSINFSPEESANSITSVILNGIKLKN